MTSTDAIQIIRITNPFDPKQHVRETKELSDGVEVQLASLFPIGLADEHVVSVNGHIIEVVDYEVTWVENGDHVVMCPVPQGGGGGKSILRAVAMLAVVIFAGYAAPLLAGAYFGGSAIAGLAITAGITFAGSMLVNALLPVKPAQDSSNSNDLAQSSSYGIDGAKNVAAEGIPVPVVYGEFRFGGNLLDYFVENVSNNTQLLYLLFNAGEGPLFNISDLEINGQPVTNYHDVEWQTRLGTKDQDVIPWFANTTVPETVGQKLTTDWTLHTMLAEADKLRFDVVCPQGLVHINKDTGAPESQTVEIEIEYRAVGAPNWTPLSQQDTIAASNTIATPVEVKQGSLSLTVPKDEQVAAYSYNLQLTDKTRSAVRGSFPSPKLTNAVYETRMRRKVAQASDDPTSEAGKYTIDEIWISDVNRILLSQVRMKNTALVALKIKLTDQLSGLPTVTHMNHGRVIRQWDATHNEWILGPSSNPAWITLDMMTMSRYGGDIPDERIDLDRWREWAQYCDDNNLTFNGVIDTESNLWDAMQYVLRCGRAQVFNVGTRYSVVMERPDVPVMMFSVANMVQDSYKETWLPLAERANEIEVTFFDSSDSYKQKTIKVFDKQAIAAAARQKTAPLTLIGVVDPTRAWQEGRLQLNFNRYILKTVEFEAPLEALACTVGDLVLVQHDMPAYAQAGRTIDGSTSSSVRLDRPVTMEANKSYKLLMLLPVVKRNQGQIVNVVGNTVFLSNFSDNFDASRRLFVASMGIDVEVTSSGSNFVTVADPAGLSSGLSYELYATDVIEEREAVTVPGSTSTVDIVGSFSAAPAYRNWMFGEVAKVKQPFRIKSVKGANNEYTRVITAIQYDLRAFDTTDNPNFGVGSGAPTNPAQSPLGQVRFLSVSEETFISGDNVRTEVMVTWQSPLTGVYAGSDVYMSVNGEAYVMMTSTSGASRKFTTEQGRGTVLKFKIVAFDINGKRANYDFAPETTYTVKGTPPNINTGLVTGVDLIWSGRDCKISWRYNSTSQSFEFGSELNGGDDGALDPQFKDYEVKIFRDSDGKELRTEYVTANSYIYTYEFNHNDNDSIHGPQRRLKIQVAQRDRFNRVGKPASIVALNPQSRIDPNDITLVANFSTATLTYRPDGDPDFAGVMIWYAAEMPIEAKPEYLVFDGADNSFVFNGLFPKHTAYYLIAAYDSFGRDGMTIIGPLEITTGLLNIEAIADGILGVDLLEQELRDRIDLIDGPIGLANSVANRIASEANARATAILDTKVYADAAILNESQARVNGDTATATSVSILAARTDTNQAAIFTEQTARTTADSALSTRVDAVLATTNSNQAAITSEISARTTADSALAQSINGLSSTVGSNRAEYLSLIQTQADSNSATVTQVNALTSTVNGNQATVSQMSSSVNGLLAQYTVKIDVNGFVAGFGLASANIGGVQVSEFAVLADKFSIQIPGVASARPFTVGVVDGQPSVVMSRALIGDAFINSAMIADATITDLKVQTLSIGRMKINGIAQGAVVIGPGVFNQGVGHASGRSVVVTTWSPNGVPQLSSMDGDQFTIRLNNEDGGAVFYSFF